MKPIREHARAWPHAARRVVPKAFSPQAGSILMRPAANSLQIVGNGSESGRCRGGVRNHSPYRLRRTERRPGSHQLAARSRRRAVFWLAMYVVAQVFGVLAGLGDWARGRGQPERWVAPPWSDETWRDVD
jgi:hypothetical protein